MNRQLWIAMWTIALLPFVCAAEVQVSNCQSDLLATYFSIVQFDDESSAKREINRSRSRLARAIDVCPLPPTGVSVKSWRVVTDLETAIVADSARAVTRALSMLSEGDLKRWSQPGRTDGMHPVLLAAGFASIEVLEVLLDHETAVMVEDEFGNTPLHVAVSRPDVDRELVLLLIRLGVDVNSRARHGVTALRSAVILEREQVAAELLRHGARVCPAGPGDTSIVDVLSGLRSPSLQLLVMEHAFSADSACGVGSATKLVD